MLLLCYVNGVEIPVTDGSVPHIPDSKMVLFYRETDQQDWRHLTELTVPGTVAEFDAALNRYGLRGRPMPPPPWRSHSSFLDMCEMTNLRNEDGTRTDLELAVRRFHNLPIPEDE